MLKTNLPFVLFSFLFIVDHGFFKVETKTKTQNGIEFTVNGNSNHDTKKFTGSLETKYKWSDYGNVLLFFESFEF